MYIHFRIIFTSLWGHFGVTLGSFWIHFGVFLRSLWAHFEISLGSIWDHSGVILVSFWPSGLPPPPEIGSSRISSATAGMGQNPDSGLEIQPFYRIWIAGLEPDYLRPRSNWFQFNQLGFSWFRQFRLQNDSVSGSFFGAEAS